MSAVIPIMKVHQPRRVRSGWRRKLDFEVDANLEKLGGKKSFKENRQNLQVKCSKFYISIVGNDNTFYPDIFRRKYLPPPFRGPDDNRRKAGRLRVSEAMTRRAHWWGELAGRTEWVTASRQKNELRIEPWRGGFLQEPGSQARGWNFGGIELRTSHGTSKGARTITNCQSDWRCMWL